jgi:hypothetical protein
MMLRFLAGVFLILHGLVHLLWFVVPWRITTVNGLPYSTSVLAGRIEVGAAGVRIVGLLWLAAVVPWVAAGLGLMALAPWWQALAVGAALFSSVLCVLGLPEAKWGVLIDLIILALLFLNGRFHWLPTVGG